MDAERWQELMDIENTNAELTDAERAEGWHFCGWCYGVLVNENDPDIIHCLCQEPEVHRTAKQCDN